MFQECELLILLRLRWELSATTALDYLDHILPRLNLPSYIPSHTLRHKTEAIIAQAVLDYTLCYKAPSLIAATALFIALRCCIAEKPKTMACLLSEDAAKRQDLLHDKFLREAKRCLQILTLAGGEDLDSCCLYLAETLPDKLTGHQRMGPMPVSPDSTMTRCPRPCPVIPYDGVTSTTSPPRPDRLADHHTSPPSRAGRDQTPDFCSAVDVFSDFNASVLQVIVNPSDSGIDSQNLSSSILCS